jgi:hypothetical protein
MKIAWFSELPFEGKTDRKHSNMRTEYAWFAAQNAYHHNIFSLSSLTDYTYDLGIIIIPKNTSNLLDLDLVKQLKRVCKKYAFMQEGPSWYFQDLPLQNSLWFFDIMFNADFVLAHNDCDKDYYEGLLKKPCYINPTLMIEDPIDVSKLSNKKNRKNVIIGGNLVRWYGGFNSLMVAKEIDCDIYAPKMGRMDKLEEFLDDIKHLPYMTWDNWIIELSKFKYAVHLNPNSIGGTFSLNCAYLGIPCIGNINSNTQRICFPELSVHSDDIKSAKVLINKLYNDTDFYLHCSKKSMDLYSEHFSELKYIDVWKQILNNISKI